MQNSGLSVADRQIECTSTLGEVFENHTHETGRTLEYKEIKSLMSSMDRCCCCWNGDGMKQAFNYSVLSTP